MDYKTYMNAMREIEKTLREEFDEEKYWNKKTCVQCSHFCFVEVRKSKNNRFIEFIFNCDKKNLPYNSQNIDIYNHKCKDWNKNIIKRSKNE